MSEYENMKADYERLQKLERVKLESEVIADLRTKLAEAQRERDTLRALMREAERVIDVATDHARGYCVCRACVYLVSRKGGT